MKRWRVRIATVAGAFLILSVIPFGASAADPPSAIVSPGTPTVDWTGPARTASTDGPSDAQCTAPPDPIPASCDDFFLTGDVAASYWTPHTGGVLVDITGIPP